MKSERVTARLRKIVSERAGECCEYCWSQSKYSTESFSVEHIRPRGLRGKSTPDNLALACQGCNSRKAMRTEGQDPLSGRIVPFYNPRQQVWSDHFEWGRDFSVIVGTTVVGRATVEGLQLNREGVVHLRRVLSSVGEHPPGAWQRSAGKIL
jgi:HNH endonuclease